MICDLRKFNFCLRNSIYTTEHPDIPLIKKNGMKNIRVSLMMCLIALISCNKEEKVYTTSFQLHTQNYFTKETLPQVYFELVGTNGSANNFQASTNDYGNFDTIFTHHFQTDFEFGTPYGQDFQIIQTGSKVEGGTNSELTLELIPTTTFNIDFLCTGNGGVQNIKRTFIFPDSIPQHILEMPAGQDYYYSQQCGSSVYTQVFCGEWVISYQKKTCPSCSFVEYVDTVSIESGLPFSYTIQY